MFSIKNFPTLTKNKEEKIEDWWWEKKVGQNKILFSSQQSQTANG